MKVKPITVTDFSNIVKNIVEKDEFLSQVCIKGEVSNFKRNTSGHIYFTLKDETSVVKCIMFKGFVEKAKENADLKDGDNIYVLRKSYCIWRRRILPNTGYSYKKRRNRRIIRKV